MTSTLLVDCHYLCYRSMYTIGDLSFEDKPTGVVFGFLNQILQLSNKFNHPNFIFAWDSKRSFRKDSEPNYKRKTPPTEEIQKLLDVARPQFYYLRSQILPYLGFLNNFIQNGLEADDIIAMAIRYLDYKTIYIISADNDLYQLLSPTCNMYDPKKKAIYTMDSFWDEWGVNASDWPYIKALAGCKGDNVKGIPRVGEKTAIKWFKGELRGKMADIISTQCTKMYKRNLPLVSLPHSQTNPINIVQDNFQFKHFEDLCVGLKFTSFLKKGVYEKWKAVLRS